MSRMTLEQAARWCGGTVAPQYAQVSFLGASNDSRSLEPGQLFVALEGARDGHEFIPGALAAGAAAVLCSRCDGDFPAIVVRDPRKALGDIARPGADTPQPEGGRGHRLRGQEYHQRDDCRHPLPEIPHR